MGHDPGCAVDPCTCLGSAGPWPLRAGRAAMTKQFTIDDYTGTPGCVHVVSETADEPDRCTLCGALACPDCNRTVNYDTDTGTYSHVDPSGCWLARNQAGEVIR